MRIVRYDEFGPAEVLRVETADDPVPGPGQVLIRTERVGLNYIDVALRSGTAGPWQPEKPGNLTGEVVGRVEAVGAEVTGVAPGDRVAALVAENACADLVVADADWLAAVPEDLDGALATALPMLAPLAAGLLRFGRVEAGETVLVHTAAGAVGQLAVQLAKQDGARVIGTTRSPGKAEAIRRLGADEVVITGPAAGRATEGAGRSVGGEDTGLEWAGRVREVAPGGVDVVLDALGAGAVDANVGLLAPYGRMVVYGALDLELPVVGMRQLYGLRSVGGFSSLGWRAARPGEVRAVMADLTERFRTGRLRLDVTETPLEDPVAAHKLLEDPGRVGRVVLTV